MTQKIEFNIAAGRRFSDRSWDITAQKMRGHYSDWVFNNVTVPSAFYLHGLEIKSLSEYQAPEQFKTSIVGRHV